MDSDLERHLGKYYGKYSGIVTSLADTAERYQGRVKVKIPAILGESEEVWARPCFQPGHFFVPPLGSHVWIEFEGGDIRSPLWVGVWYPIEDVPPLAQEKKEDASVIKTPHGHLLEINDKEGEEQIHIRHARDKWEITISPQGDMTIRVMGDQTENISGRLQISVEGSVEITAQSGVVIHDAENIQLGQNAQDHVMLFEKFAQWWDSSFLVALNAHVHPNLGAIPTPLIPSVIEQLTSARITKAK